jgi:hypothetical protein
MAEKCGQIGGKELSATCSPFYGGKPYDLSSSPAREVDCKTEIPSGVLLHLKGPGVVYVSGESDDSTIYDLFFGGGSLYIEDCTFYSGNPISFAVRGAVVIDRCLFARI